MPSVIAKYRPTTLRTTITSPKIRASNREDTEAKAEEGLNAQQTFVSCDNLHAGEELTEQTLKYSECEQGHLKNFYSYSCCGIIHQGVFLFAGLATLFDNLIESHENNEKEALSLRYAMCIAVTYFVIKLATYKLFFAEKNNNLKKVTNARQLEEINKRKAFTNKLSEGLLAATDFASAYFVYNKCPSDMQRSFLIHNTFFYVSGFFVWGPKVVRLMNKLQSGLFEKTRYNFIKKLEESIHFILQKTKYMDKNSDIFNRLLKCIQHVEDLNILNLSLTQFYEEDEIPSNSNSEISPELIIHALTEFLRLNVRRGVKIISYENNAYVFITSNNASFVEKKNLLRDGVENFDELMGKMLEVRNVLLTLASIMGLKEINIKLKSGALLLDIFEVENIPNLNYDLMNETLKSKINSFVEYVSFQGENYILIELDSYFSDRNKNRQAIKDLNNIHYTSQNQPPNSRAPIVPVNYTNFPVVEDLTTHTITQTIKPRKMTVANLGQWYVEPEENEPQDEKEERVDFGSQGIYDPLSQDHALTRIRKVTDSKERVYYKNCFVKISSQLKIPEEFSNYFDSKEDWAEMAQTEEGSNGLIIPQKPHQKIRGTNIHIHAKLKIGGDGELIAKNLPVIVNGQKLYILNGYYRHKELT